MFRLESSPVVTSFANFHSPVYSSLLVPLLHLQMSPAGRSWNWTILNLSSNTRYSGNFPIIVILILLYLFYLGIEQSKVLAFVYGFKHQTWIMKFLSEYILSWKDYWTFVVLINTFSPTSLLNSWRSSAGNISEDKIFAKLKALVCWLIPWD